MHELSIALELIRAAEQALAGNPARRARKVYVQIGALSGVDAGSLEFCFPVAARETALEGAELVLEKVPVQVRCGACGATYEAYDWPSPICEQCGSLGVEFHGGDDLRLTEMEVD